MQLNSPAWIHDWRESCKTFESLESNRLDYLKAVIKTYDLELHYFEEETYIFSNLVFQA